MTDPAKLLADQAEEIADSDTIPVLRAVEILGQWGEALIAALDVHPREDLTSPFAASKNYVCGGCIGSDEEPLPWPCPTVAAITAALEAK